MLAAPKSTDAYYAKMYDKIIRFQAEYVNAILKANKDDVLILADKKASKLLAKEIPKKNIANYPVEDIWMRDFSTVPLNGGVQFRYTAAAQGDQQQQSDFVQREFNKSAKKMGLSFKPVKYLLDGGNVVFAKNKAIVTKRFLQDNKLTQRKGEALLRELLDVENVAIIESDDQEGLAHADGMVSFIEDDVLLVNKYSGKFRKEVLHKLKSSFPKTKIVEVPYKVDEKVWDEKMSSACGISLNSLVTETAVYVPVFGQSIDRSVLKLIHENTTKAVIPINASGICIMGGSARCLTWQLKERFAKRFKAAITNER